LASDSWLSTSGEAIFSIIKQKRLKIKEADILEALIKWGTANVEEGGDVRGAIDSSLRLIRFRCLEKVEFGRICCTIGKILTETEKLNILLSITLEDEKLMPPNFSIDSTPRNLSDRTSFHWNKSGHQIRALILEEDAHPPSKFTFSINEAGFYLEGVRLECLSFGNKGKHLKLTCSLHKADELLATVTFDGENNFEEDDVLYFPFPTHLTKNVSYTINVEYLEGFPIHSKSRSFLGQTLKFEPFSLQIIGCHEITDIWALHFAEVNKL